MSRRADILSLVLVSIVALLIWLVAEDYTSEDTTIQTRLDFTPSNVRHYVVDPPYTEVTLQLGGTNRAINKMRTLLQNESLAITSPAGNGPHTFEDLAAQIRSIPGVRETGVSIDGVEPANFSIDITELVTVDAVVSQHARRHAGPGFRGQSRAGDHHPSQGRSRHAAGEPDSRGGGRRGGHPAAGAGVSSPSTAVSSSPRGNARSRTCRSNRPPPGSPSGWSPATAASPSTRCTSRCW